MTPDRRSSPSPRRLLPGVPSIVTGAMLAIVIVALVAAMSWAMRLRGPWYDEFYTLYGAQPAIPLPHAFDRWLADNHPPLFYALVRATAWLGSTVEERRFVNLILFMGAAIQLAWWLIPQHLRRIGWVFAIAIASAWPAIDRAAELRSNYLAFAASAVAVAALIGFGRGHRAARGVEWGMLTLALLVALSVHLATSMIVGWLVAAMVMRRLLARDWPGAIRLATAAIVAAVPMLLHLALSFGRIEANTRSFWIQGGFNSARWAIQTEVVRNLSANPAVTIVALVGCGVLAYQSWRARRLARDADLAVTLGAGLALGCMVMIAIHLWRPFVIDRYLVALHPPLAMILALGAGALLDRIRPIFAVILSLLMAFSAMTAIPLNAGATVARPSWYGTGQAIAAIRRNCPTTRVHVDLRGNRPVLDAPPTENRAVIPFAYRTVAAHFGFSLASPNDRTMPLECPTLFWTEHVAGESVTAESLAAPLRAAGFPIGRARLLRIGDGHVLEAWPAR